MSLRLPGPASGLRERPLKLESRLPPSRPPGLDCWLSHVPGLATLAPGWGPRGFESHSARAWTGTEQGLNCGACRVGLGCLSLEFALVCVPGGSQLAARSRFVARTAALRLSGYLGLVRVWFLGPVGSGSPV